MKEIDNDQFMGRNLQRVMRGSSRERLKRARERTRAAAEIGKLSFVVLVASIIVLVPPANAGHLSDGRTIDFTANGEAGVNFTKTVSKRISEDLRTQADQNRDNEVDENEAEDYSSAMREDMMILGRDHNSTLDGNRPIDFILIHFEMHHVVGPVNSTWLIDVEVLGNYIYDIEESDQYVYRETLSESNSRMEWMISAPPGYQVDGITGLDQPKFTQNRGMVSGVTSNVEELKITFAREVRPAPGIGLMIPLLAFALIALLRTKNNVWNISIGHP